MNIFFLALSKNNLRKIAIIFLSISLNIEALILSTHNICFGWEIRKIIFSYALLSGGLQMQHLSWVYTSWVQFHIDR